MRIENIRFELKILNSNLNEFEIFKDLDILTFVRLDWHHLRLCWHSLTKSEENIPKYYFTEVLAVLAARKSHVLKKVAKFIKLIKRFLILQEWLKTSDIWRDYQVWKKNFLKLFQSSKFWCSSTSEH
jgi:hypothetical protein